MTKYELLLTYDDGFCKKEEADLPNLMAALAIYFTAKDWRYAAITNCSTGEVIAQWTNYGEYGITWAG